MPVKNAISLSNLDSDFVIDIIKNKIYNKSILSGSSALVSNLSVVEKIWFWINTTDNKISHYWNGTSWIELLSVNSNIRISSTSTTITSSDNTIVFTTVLTQALPVSVNKQVINLKNNSNDTLTITGHIDNTLSSTILVSSKSSLQLHGDGTTWWII